MAKLKPITTLEWLNILANKYSLNSWYQVAKFLKKDKSTVHSWTSGRSFFDEESAILIAEKLDIDPFYVVTCCQYERAERRHKFAVRDMYYKALQGLEKPTITMCSAFLTVLSLSDHMIHLPFF